MSSMSDIFNLYCFFSLNFRIYLSNVTHYSKTTCFHFERLCASEPISRIFSFQKNWQILLPDNHKNIDYFITFICHWVRGGILTRNWIISVNVCFHFAEKNQYTWTFQLQLSLSLLHVLARGILC